MSILYKILQMKSTYLQLSVVVCNEKYMKNKIFVLNLRTMNTNLKLVY